MSSSFLLICFSFMFLKCCFSFVLFLSSIFVYYKTCYVSVFPIIWFLLVDLEGIANGQLWSWPWPYVVFLYCSYVCFSLSIYLCILACFFFTDLFVGGYGRPILANRLWYLLTFLRSTSTGMINAGIWTRVARFGPHITDHYTTDPWLDSIHSTLALCKIFDVCYSVVL